MSDQGFSRPQMLVENIDAASSRVVPIGPAVLTDTSAPVAFGQEGRIMRVAHLAVCNPTAAAITLQVAIKPAGGADVVQIPSFSVDAGASVDVTDMLGQLYPPKANLTALGEGLILSGWYESIK